MKPGRDFKGKVVVITGAASGIGLAAARRFARAGAHLALLDLQAERLRQCADELACMEVKVLARTCDIADQAACEAAVAAVLDVFGGIDVLFNNAGITQRGAFADTRVDVFRRVMEVNFFGALYCTRAAIGSLIRRRGLIIVNESLAGVAPLLGRSGYSASKHALHGLFTSLRTEVAGLGVHVLIVCPGFVRTDLQARALGTDGGVTRHPQSRIGRQAEPDQVADAIFRAAARERKLLILTAVGKLGYWISRVAPGLYERIMAAQLRSELAYKQGAKGSWG